MAWPLACSLHLIDDSPLVSGKVGISASLEGCGEAKMGRRILFSTVSYGRIFYSLKSHLETGATLSQEPGANLKFSFYKMEKEFLKVTWQRERERENLILGCVPCSLYSS